MELEPVIGLEIHVQLKTKSKMFCSCANMFPAAAGPRQQAVVADVPPNSCICPMCLGSPGTLPVPNRQAIEWTQLAGAALNCELATKSKFDRKSYFSPDLPKGYQISQYDQPFCGKGELLGVGITRIHLEEDAAKNVHPEGANYTLIDFNRAGTPLMEIVTEPDIRSPQQAKEFLQEIQRIMRALKISDADMEKGQLRCDANISLREKGSSELHPKTEVKNINSFRFVEKALQYEINRQTREWEETGPPQQQSTRGFNAAKGETYEQRTKEAAADYRYFPEPDIPPFQFSASELEQRRLDVPELPHQRRQRLQEQFNLTPELASAFAEKIELAGFFEQVGSEVRQLINDREELTSADEQALLKQAANLITRHLGGEKVNISPANCAELVVLIHLGAVNKSSLAQVLAEMQRTGGDPDHIIQNLGLAQVSGADELTQVVEEVIAGNPDIVAKIKAGKEAAIQALVGQVMAKTRGTANPAIVLELLKKHLD